MAEIVDNFEDVTDVNVVLKDEPIDVNLSGIDKPTITLVVPGPQGPPGDDGKDAGTSFTHIQQNPSTLWTMQHNLGYHPTVTVLDNDGNLILGWKIDWQSNNVLLLRFPVVQSGVANAS